MTPAGRILGIDYGTVRIGVAVSDPGRSIAFPLQTLTRRSQRQDSEWFRKLARDEAIVAIMVGLPVRSDGRDGEKATEARNFGKWLADITSLPVYFYDEPLSTIFAESALWEAGLTHKRRKERRDQVAAQLVLQAFLDAGCPPDAVPEKLTGEP